MELCQKLMLIFAFLKHMNKVVLCLFPLKLTTTSKIPNRLTDTFSG